MTFLVNLETNTRGYPFEAVFQLSQCSSVVLVIFLQNTRHSLTEVFGEKVFLKISQNSQENTRVRASILINLQSSGLKLY